ncbi:MAG: hypothetical protein NDJ90_02895 [Oligoflexia bacterium]|nr:hypothetical protein [Oligoflexia bacterium]
MLLLLAAATAARAESLIPSNPPAASFRWVGSNGEVLKATWPFKSDWQWLKLNPTDAFERPVFRTAVRVPEGVLIEKFEVSGGLITFIQGDEGQPGVKQQIMAVDTLSPQTVVRLKIKEKSFRRDITLMIDLAEAAPQIWMHESCQKENVRLRLKEKTELGHLFMGGYCKVEQNQLRLTLFWSGGIDHKGGSLPGKLKMTGEPLRQTFEIPTPGKDAGSPPFQLGDARFSGTQGFTAAKSATYQVEWVPRRPMPRFMHSASLGFSYLSYQEDPIGVKVNESGLTGKYLFSYWLLPEKIDVSANGYITLLPFMAKTQGPEGMSVAPSRFFGINGRTGYQIAKDSHGLGNFNLKFSLGWYVWGMLVPGSNYGTNFVMGPQLLASVGGATLGSGRSWSGYVKLSPISDTNFTVSLSSREIAAGGSYEVSRVGIPHPIFMTLDMAHAGIKFATAANEISLLSLSLGVSYGL